MITIFLIQVRALEREVSDLQSEFQLDRSDYLESIRRLEKNLRFFQQLIEKAVPVLRKEGRYWDPDAIKSNSIWCVDLDKWKLPEDAMTRLKLPPAGKFIFKYDIPFRHFFSRCFPYIIYIS